VSHRAVTQVNPQVAPTKIASEAESPGPGRRQHELSKSDREQLRTELTGCTYRPVRVRKVGIPKSGGKIRVLSIPTIRDRVVQGALKLILEPIFEADFQPGSFGYRPKKSPREAVQRVSKAIVSGKTYVIDLDLRAYFDNVKHHILFEKVAVRVNDAKGLRNNNFPFSVADASTLPAPASLNVRNGTPHSSCTSSEAPRHPRNWEVIPAPTLR